MANLTPPRAGIPVGKVTIQGVEYDAMIHPEWLRYLSNGLFDRAGGVAGPSTVEAAQEAGGNAGTEEARAAITELRSDMEQFANHGRIAASEEMLLQLASMDPFAMMAQISALREQVATLTDRINSAEQAPAL